MIQILASIRTRWELISTAPADFLAHDDIISATGSLPSIQYMMTSSNGNIFRVTGWEGNSPVTGEFPSQRPVTRSSDVFFDPCLNKRLSKQSRRRWFVMPSHPLWGHCNDTYINFQFVCSWYNCSGNFFLLITRQVSPNYKLVILKEERTELSIYHRYLLRLKHET